MLNYYLPGSSSWELGLVLLGSMTVTILLLMLCACLKRKRGTIVSDSNKNGHMFGSSRTNGAEADFDDESLRGARATSHRRLPDIPDPLLNGLEDPLVRHSSVRSSQDTSSELYAQVEIGAISNSFPVNPNTAVDHSEAVRNGAATFNPQTSNNSETHPYDKVKTNNHGYSKIKKKSENPYAKVKRSDTMESEPAEADENETDTDNYDVVYTLHHTDETKKATDSSPKPGSSSSSGSSTNTENFASLAPPPLPLPLRGSHSSLASGGAVGAIGHDVPRPPPRGRRSIVGLSSYSSSSSSSLMATQIHRPNSMVLVNDHPDAGANGDDLIDGAVAANEEGHGHPPHEANGVVAVQIHFSGDSQTSQDSKGYSSISVREPLANLKAQNPRPGAVQVGRQRMNSASHHHQNQQQQQRQQQRQPESSDPHYATVSDAEDSDEMYAAIAELQPIYDSGGAGGSDTYAKIADHRTDMPAAAEATSPIASASGISMGDPIYASTTAPALTTSISPHPIENDMRSPSPLPPTPPSVVSLKQLSSASGSGSSRLHASTLSIASTTSGVGSPKPEKRQANSPLPPPPIHQQQSEAEGGSRKSMNVEEMYAKVMKKKGMTLHPWQVQQQLLYSSEAAATSFNTQTQHHRGSVDLGFLSTRDEEPRDTSSFIHVSSRRSSVDASPPHRVGQDVNDSVLIVETSSGQEDVVVEEEEEEEDDDEYDLRYEVLPAPRPEINRLGAGRTISESDPGYERIQLKSEDSFNDPRYERIQPKRSSDIVEPNYEIVGFQGAVIRESNEPGYEEVELPPTAKFDRQDPNYESLHYAVNHQHSVRPRSDPPYATVGHADFGADSADFEENEEALEEATTELVNNNTVGQPVYAQVVKPKRTNLKSASVFVEDPIAAGAAATSGVEITHSPDFSVSSSKNTTIIRITDSRPAYRFFTEDAESFGVPEQV